MRNSLLKVLLSTSLLLAVFPVIAAQQTGKVQQEAKALREADVTCIQSAIYERDTSLANMTGDWSSSVKEALEARRDAEKASWDISDQRNVGLFSERHGETMARFFALRIRPK
jgi:hypothetical protein